MSAQGAGFQSGGARSAVFSAGVVPPGHESIVEAFGVAALTDLRTTSRFTERAGAEQTEDPMAESVYKLIDLVGTSTESWEKAATAAVERASKTLRDLRIAEVAELDLQIEDGKVRAYRAKVRVSFKYED